MDSETFGIKMKAAETFLNHEPEKFEYWEGYIRGLHRNCKGSSFGTDAEHMSWLGLNTDTGDYRRYQRHQGYRDGFFINNDSIQCLCPECNKPLFFDGILLVEKYAVFGCACGSAMDYEIKTGKWSQ
ncbi:MAG: hypothetical protein KKG99_17465 [Bacteroidetes bacterium]|nr:hypothetical protein [Bacteroidota bacterium]